MGISLKAVVQNKLEEHGRWRPDQYFFLGVIERMT
jgi:hypothetical protein